MFFTAKKLFQTIVYSALLASLFISLFSCASPRTKSLKAFNKAAAHKPFDAIIVPGIPYDGKKWDMIMKGRVLWASLLYKMNYTKNIIFSGGAVYTPYLEAKVMKLYAEQLGVPAENILVDTIAQHSTENVYYSYLLAKQAGYKSIALATDPFQSWTMKSFMKRRFESPIYRIPFVIDTLSKHDDIEVTIDASSAMASQPWSSLKEKEGFLKRWRGTRGKHIDWSKHKNKKVGAL